MRFARVVGEILAWSAVAFSIWMLSLSEAPLQELLLAGAVSLPTGVAAYLGRRATGASWTLRLRWLRPLLLAPIAILTDAAQVLMAVVRPGQPGGKFITVPTGAIGETGEPCSHRAIATFMMSVTPGSFVLDADPDTGHLTVHSLASKGPRMEKVVEQ